MVEKLGRCRWPVLLLGETGTGKEVAARAIHRVLGEGPFVTIDCSSMVGPLMESELFGHARGAFTGACQSKLGLIELAHGGTAFFDESGELPLDLQGKLLRVLQQKEFRPVGSLTPRRSDFRIVSATNRDLAREAERGTFRRDLYYRLSVVNLRMTPLRDRKDDIPPLLVHFLERHGTRHVLSREALEAILSYDWPGNVRELENCIQHMVAVNSGPLLLLANLPSSVLNHAQAMRSLCQAAAATADAGGLPAVSPPLHSGDGGAAAPILPLTEIEKRAIAHTLEYTKGDRVMAANLLGIGRTTLYRKIKEYALAR
ncbi:MAG: sigma-54-dependent Fis family transcriptional regulator [Acidobacteria bacterium]|nr:sigma-54-dependent Fis family transcriptional regulator [Acidobacteriota bacterium]